MYEHERSLVKDYSGRPFVLLGVNNDKEIKRTKKAIKENNLNWRSWYDGGRGPIVRDYGIRSFPTIFLVDHHGVVRYKNTRGKKLDAAIKKLVEEAEADGVTGGSEPTPKMREFVDSTGKHKTEAVYRGFDSGNVVLETADGEETMVPWNRLSLDDQRYVAGKRLVADGLQRIAKKEIPFSFDSPMTFTDSSGKHSIEGTFICLDRTEALIWDTSGNEIRIQWKKLNDETKNQIQQENKRRKN